MLIKQLIDKLRAKGYDDFYMANLASKYDNAWFFFVGLVQVLCIAMIVLWPLAAIGKLEGAQGDIAEFVANYTFILWVFSWMPQAYIRTSKDNGETDLRVSYMISSWVSKIVLKMFRYAPVISMIFLVIALVNSIIMYGFRWQMLLSSAIGIALLLAFSPLYHKLMNKISKEGAYYVDWKTNQDVEHFEETYSRHEKWWLSESEMKFEKFNIDRYRSIRLAAFIGTFGCSVASIVFALSLSPLFGLNLNTPVKKKVQIEQITNAENSNATRQNVPTTSLNTNAEPAEAMDADVVEDEDPIGDGDVPSGEPAGTTDADVVEDEDPIGDGDVPSGKPAEEVQPTSAEVLSLSEVDDMPTMSDGGNIKQGIASYLKSHIPELSKKKIYVEFKISEKGHIYDVDASLVSDEGLRSKIEKILTSMPTVKPGRKEGHAVAVKTSIDI